MFRDPGFYKTIRQEVLPVLAPHPFIRIWHAGDILKIISSAAVKTILLLNITPDMLSERLKFSSVYEKFRQLESKERI